MLITTIKCNAESVRKVIKIGIKVAIAKVEIFSEFDSIFFFGLLIFINKSINFVSWNSFIFVNNDILL